MTSVTYTTIVAGVGNLEENTHVIDRACEMARLCDATLLLVAGFDPVSARDKARVADTAQVADVRVNEVQLTEDEAYAVVEKARDIAVERGVGLAQGVVVEGTAVSAVTLVTLEAEADLVVVGSRGVDSLLGRLFGAVSIQVLRKSRCDVLVVVEPDAASDSAAANSVAAAAVDTAVAHVVATDAAAKTAGKPADADAGKPGAAKLVGKPGAAKLVGKPGAAKIVGKPAD